MIKINNNIEYLKVNNSKILDLNDSINEIFTEILLEIKSKLEPLHSTHDAEINITGNTKEYSFAIITENNDTANLIENIIDDVTN